MAIDRGDKEQEPDIEELLSDLEHKIDRLKILYEQYFMGIEKIEPQTARKEITRKMIEITQLNIRNTGIRYRFNALGQKWGVYQTYWNRTLREIEKGTYIRNVARVGREAVRKGQEIPEEVLKAMPVRMRERLLKDRDAIRAAEARELARREDRAARLGGKPKLDAATAHDGVVAAPRDGIVAAPRDGIVAAPRDGIVAAPMENQITAPRGSDDGKMFSGDGTFDDTFESLFDTLSSGEASRVGPRPVLPPEGAAEAVPLRAPATTTRPYGTAPPKRPPPALPSFFEESAARDLFKKYVQAKELVGEDASSVRYEQIVHTIAKQAPRIMEQHKAKGVDFQVVIKDNKVILKATPKK